LRTTDIVRHPYIQILHDHVKPAESGRHCGDGEITAGLDPAELVIAQMEGTGRASGTAKHHLAGAIGKYPDVTSQIGLTQTAGRTDIHVGADGHDIGTNRTRLNVDQATSGDLQIIGGPHQTIDQDGVASGDRNVTPRRKYVLRTVEADRCRLPGCEGTGDGSRAPGDYDDVPCGFRSPHVDIASGGQSDIAAIGQGTDRHILLGNDGNGRAVRDQHIGHVDIVADVHQAADGLKGDAVPGNIAQIDSVFRSDNDRSLASLGSGDRVCNERAALQRRPHIGPAGEAACRQIAVAGQTDR